MALPILNDKPKYEMTIPSTGEIVRFRPYLVREEKVLMLAMESEDSTQMFSSIIDTIRACVYDEKNSVKWNELAIFDIEYMFVTIRSKSVGETSKLNLKCTECEESNELVVDISDIAPVIPDLSSVIVLTDEISLEMQWPAYSDLNKAGMQEMSSTELTMMMIGNCIKYVYTADDQIILKDEPQESVTAFIDSLSTVQFEMIKNYTEKMPQIIKNIEFNCENCNHHNEIKLQGMADFF
jgi:hypothetical protein|tara:strand:- start:994 stop:1707 length:714 start_codon:yes stop_codon:yes gene_type:complete